MQKVVLSELDSGERVISERVASVRSVSLGFWIDVGSRDERADRAGVSHFIEHLLFKGSRRFEAQEIAETFDAMGAELNAATSRENTVVYARVPDHHVETALEVMTDMVFAPSFAEVDQEREVVLEEIAMYEDTPQELVHDLFSEAVFGDHPLGRPVIGTAEVISSVSRRALSGYHRTAYAPGNVVVAAAGNLEHDRLVALLQRSERRAGAPARAGTRVRRPLARLPGPGLRFQRKETEQYHLCLGAIGISRSDRRRFAASLLDSILGGSASSRLFQEIREKRGMAYAVYSFGAQYTDTGILGVYVGTREENLADVRRDLRRADRRDRGRPAPQGRARAREGEPQGTDRPLARIDLEPHEPAREVARYRHGAPDARAVMAEIDAVEPDELAELAAALLPAERLAAAGVGPDESRFRSAVARASASLVRAGGGVKIAFFGAEGKAGGAIVARLEAAGHEVRGIELGDEPDVSGCDAAVDFTTPDAAPANVRAALEQGVSCVVGTTGWDPAELGALAAEKGLRLFVAPNFSIGAVLMMRFAGEAAAHFPRAEIVELHNEAKKDAPSGTAKATADLIGGDAAIHSVRLPGLVAHQEVIFGGEGQLLTIRHDTTGRESFADGVLLALEKLDELPPGLTVGLETLL